MKKLVILLVLATLLLASCSSKGEEVVYGDIAPSDLELVLEQNPDVIILDVRTKEEYDEDRIEGAVLFPLQEIPERIGELDPEQKYVIYCRTGNRSSQAIAYPKEKGITNIFHLSGGISVYRTEIEK